MWALWKRFWQVPVGEALLWLAPLFLALMGHLYAFPKAGLAGVGPGFHIALMNERTVRAQAMWHVLAESWWLFVLYGVLLLGTHVALRIRKVPLWIRGPVLVVMAVPGVWYSGEAGYLGGKLLSLS